MKSILTILLAVIAAVATVKLLPGTAGPATAAKETAYERVMRTGVLRCGYGVLPPYLDKDPNTGEFSGLYYDYLTAITKSLGLRVEFTEETGWGEFITGLEQQRFDAFCTILTVTGGRARNIAFTDPFAYLPIVVFTQANRTSFDGNINLLNDSQYKFIAIDGQLPLTITNEDFPQADVLALPQLTPHSDLFLNLANGKVDALVAERENGFHFSQTNPNQIKEIPNSEMRRYGLSIGLSRDAHQLEEMLDNATLELRWTGKLEKIIKKHIQHPKAVIVN